MKKKHVRMLIYYLLQWTWGLPQNLLGLLITGIIRLKNPDGIRERYHYAVLTDWPFRFSSMGLGMFIFYGHRGSGTKTERMIRTHEYGHTIQSVILGPLFLPVVGIPSFVWANLPYFRRFRERKQYDYFRFYPEAWANHAGAWADSLGDFILPGDGNGLYHV